MSRANDGEESLACLPTSAFARAEGLDLVVVAVVVLSAKLVLGAASFGVTVGSVVVGESAAASS